MREPNTWRETWDLVATDAAMTLRRILQTEREAHRVMRKHLLQAQAEVFKGLLAVVEARLASAEPDSQRPASEKIKVD